MKDYSPLTRIDYSLYKAIKRKKQEIEEQVGVKIPFAVASKLFFIELENKDNIKYENLLIKSNKKGDFL